jgi:hypothetical protein
VSLTAAQARELVYQRWKALWVDALHPGFSWFLENEAHPEPADPTTPWARVTLRDVTAEQHTLGPPGARQWRREAGIWVQLYYPLNRGMASLDGLVDDVRAVFEGVAFGGIDPAGACRVTTLGSDGRWYEVVVVAPVTYYETR